jgi:hypothetical protein
MTLRKLQALDYIAKETCGSTTYDVQIQAAPLKSLAKRGKRGKCMSVNA